MPENHFVTILKPGKYCSTLTWYLNDPLDEWMYNVFSTTPTCLARNTTSNVVFCCGGTNYIRTQVQAQLLTLILQ